MRKKIIAALLAVFLLMILMPGCVTTGGGMKYGNSVGNLAYDFSLSDTNGNIVTLSGLRGHLWCSTSGTPPEFIV